MENTRLAHPLNNLSGTSIESLALWHTK